MTYPTTPALTQAQAENPSLWDGLVWAYLPGYNKLATIVGADTLSGTSDTTIDVYPEGSGETIPLGKYRQGVAKPLEGTTAATIHAHYRMLFTDDGTTSGLIGTASSSTWLNLGQMLSAGGAIRSVWRKGGTEAIAAPVSYAVHNATTNPSVNAIIWRDSSVVGAHDALVGSGTASATSISGSLTNTEPVIVGSYYDKSNTRSSNIAFFCGCVWNRALSSEERDILVSDPYAVFRKSAGATPPTGTVTIDTITPGTTSASVAYSYSAADQTGFQYRLNGGTATTLGASPATISGLTASASYSIEVRATNADGEGAWSTAANFTTSAAADTENPTLTGSVTFASITQTSYTASWPAGLDNVGVTGYEYQIGSTAGAWTDAGNNLSAAITGRTAGATETVYVRAYDAAGLRSTPAISGEVTLESIPASGINVTEPLKNNTGTVLANLSGVGVAILSASDFTYGLTTNASGILATISDAAIIPGTQYHVAIKLADGSVGITGPITAS